MTQDFYRSYQSIFEAFDIGYDMQVDRANGDISIDSGMIMHCIRRIKATQEQFGTQEILRGLIKDLYSLYNTMCEIEGRKQLIIEDERV